MLEGKVQTSIAERLQYEKSMNKEKQKWQKTLDMKKRQIKMQRAEFKRKMQELRKLQVQERNMRRKIKILERRCNEYFFVMIGISDHDIKEEVKEKCITDLLTEFNEFFDAVKLLGKDVGELDLRDLTEYIKIKKILRNKKASDDSS